MEFAHNSHVVREYIDERFQASLAHNSHVVREYIDERFQASLIGRAGPVRRPPRSLGITPPRLLPLGQHQERGLQAGTN
ncbi:hypothetical protein QE152_g20780 [Popillia japonica]|uniref:Uncharacterized protein n=1 Tax=Popillia japonica TaxID=7064 RepID=A0AAW1KPS2_POPJA